MTRPIINDNGVNREMTPAEETVYQTAINELEIETRANVEIANEKRAAYESAWAKLAALGLTEAEVAALVGA